jgi:hypothetical protein
MTRRLAMALAVTVVVMALVVGLIVFVWPVLDPPRTTGGPEACLAEPVRSLADNGPSGQRLMCPADA